MGSSVAAGAADRLADAAVARVSGWLDRSSISVHSAEARQSKQLARLVADPRAIAFTMRFVDRVTRPESDEAAAHQLAILTGDHPIPRFLGAFDRALLRVAGLVGPYAPSWIVPAARRRMRSLVSHLVADPEPDALHAHLARERARGYAINVNLLGEAVLGDAEAARRFERTLALIRDPAVDYVSVKVSAISSHINLWAYEAPRPSPPSPS
jgi:RHH-type proline utilization regulon transcriptional repressor/proline dehydrogenase/delta 1-pyrroline-5-carboxylate dehydrogenase